MKGFSITLVIGVYAGFYLRFTTVSWRICLGWIAITIFPKTDIEDVLTKKLKDF